MGYNLFVFRRRGHLVRLLRTKPAGWFKRSWPDEVADALGSVIRWLKEHRGADAGNYVLQNTTATTQADITKHNLAVTSSAVQMTYAEGTTLNGTVVGQGGTYTFNQNGATLLPTLHFINFP